MKIYQIVGAACLLILSSWALADVYKWVDEKGVTHYGNQKPPEAKAEQVKVPGGGVSNQSNLFFIEFFQHIKRFFLLAFFGIQTFAIEIGLYFGQLTARGAEVCQYPG